MPEQLGPADAAPTSWSFAVPDWQDRIRAGRSLMPTLPLFAAEAKRAVTIFNKLRLDDVAGFPTFAEVAGDWLREIIAAIFGSYDVATGVRFVRELFLLVPKKNSKTTLGAVLALIWLLTNRRPRARGVLTGAMQATADVAFGHAVGMIEADDVVHKEVHGDAAEGFLKKRFQVREHLKEIVDRVTSAKLQIRTFDPQILTGPPLAFSLLDELHLLRLVAAASRVIGQIRGNMQSQREAFFGIITTQSDEAPAGAFDEELKKGRAIRDGKFAGQMLTIAYEMPPDLVKSGAWKDPANWPMVTPNLGKSVWLDQMQKDWLDAQFKGEKEIRRWASQHLNIEIGLALASDDWAGATYWDKNPERVATLEELLVRCEIVTAGADGGGLDDLYGFAVIGRERTEAGHRWLLWTHAWCHTTVLERRKEIAPRLQDFAADGDLTIVERIGDDVMQIADLVEQIHKAGKFPETGAIGVDPAGIGALLDELGNRGISISSQDVAGMVDGVPQGWQLMSAIKTVERKLAGGEIVHGNTRLMAWCAGNAKVEPRANGILITKQASGFAKIDPLMATFNAAALMAKNPQPSGRGIFEFYRDGAAATTAPAAPAQAAAMAKLRAPSGISTIYGLSGRQYVVGADHIVDVTEEDAKPLVGQGFEQLTETVN